jgi:hypothetical protein
MITRDELAKTLYEAKYGHPFPLVIEWGGRRTAGRSPLRAKYSTIWRQADAVLALIEHHKTEEERE